ncbi:phage major tail tube protein [Rappaport israeli]|uniref:phage major tail tube protein n=1 Tax=Rappaport israeli TaxID=1839807 RepID=UPI00093130E4|nr:phage major tail tube protein [Rappaport israeli]
MLPKLIKDAILSVDGHGYAGRIKSIQWPKLARKFEEYRAGGMHGPVEVDLGGEKMEMEFELDEQSAELLRLWGACSATAVRFRINASAESDNPDCNGNAIEVVCLGRLREIDPGQYQPGEIQTAKYGVAVTTLTYRLDGETLIDIDNANNILVVNGVDLLEKRREHLRM